MRKTIIFAVLMAACAAGFCQPQISIDPAAFSFSMYQYETGSDSMTISNTGTDSLYFKIKECLPGGGGVNILAWVRYADIDQEWEHTVESLDMFLPAYILDTTYTENPAMLETLLFGKNCMLIPEQESAPNLFNLGISWAGALNNFVNQGGLILVLDIEDAAPLLEGAGLMNIDVIDHSNDLQDMHITEPDHPFFTGLAFSFTVDNAWNVHTAAEGVQLASFRGQNHMTIRQIGSGNVVYWGVDFYEYTTGMAQILCNIVSFNDDIGWLNAHPMFGWLDPGESAAIYLEASSGSSAFGDYEGQLAVISNAPGSPDTVEVELTVLPPLPGVISVEPESIGVELMMGSCALDSFLVSNTGPGFLNYYCNFNPIIEMEQIAMMGKTAETAVLPAEFRRQNPGFRPEWTDDVYTGSNMSFGITNNYGEIMPFQFPVGNEHLQVAGLYSGYTLSYIAPGGQEYLAFAIYNGRSNITMVSYEELASPPNYVKVKTISRTSNNAVEYTQYFTFDINHSFVVVEAIITNIGAAPVNDLYYKISADWDVDNDYDDDNWNRFRSHTDTLKTKKPPGRY